MSQAQHISYLRACSVRIPIVGVRVGRDGLMGLISAIGGLVAFYTMAMAHRAGFSWSTKLKMLGTSLFDVLIGLIPVFGDVAGFIFKGQRPLAHLMVQELEAETTSLSFFSQEAYA